MSYTAMHRGHRRGCVVPPQWTDAYGTTRTAKEMTDDHLWNVMAYIRERLRRRYVYWSNFVCALEDHRFYRAAQAELKRRLLLHG